MKAVARAWRQFDPELYGDQARRLVDKPLSRTKLDLFLHYHRKGWRQGLNPNGQFATRFYCTVNPDVADAGMNPFFHYMAFGRQEERLTAPADEDLVRIAESLVDEQYYRAMHGHENVAPFGSAAVHFATVGWAMNCNPNPLVHMSFVRRHAPEAFRDSQQLLRYLQGSIFQNALMRRPASYTELSHALETADTGLADLFVFDVEGYSSFQLDVLSRTTAHPVKHLFRWGLHENRLRSRGFLDPLLLPELEDYPNDYQFLASRSAPLKDVAFWGLDLGQEHAENRSVLSEQTIGIGVVLYENDRSELEALVDSIVANTIDAPFSAHIHFWDNSPEPLDLAWLAERCAGLDVHLTHHADNPGFALGHNGLMAQCFEEGCTHYLGLNPDGHLLSGAVEEALLFAIGKGEPALIELDAEPLSHPKRYHPVSGETAWVSGAAFLMDSTTYERTGGFDPDFPMYCEDVDLSFRAFQNGSGLYVAPRARFYHDTTDRLHHPDPDRALKMMIGSWYLCMKWGNPVRAQSIHTDILNAAGKDVPMPERPDQVENIPPKISTLMGLERFSKSRFWA